MVDPTKTTPIPFSEGSRVDYTTIELINARFDRNSVRMQGLADQLERSAARMQGLAEKLADNTEMTAEIHDAWLGLKSGLGTIAKIGRGLARVGGWIRKAVIWLAPLAAAGVAVWHALHGGPKQ